MNTTQTPATPSTSKPPKAARPPKAAKPPRPLNAQHVDSAADKPAANSGGRNGKHRPDTKRPRPRHWRNDRRADDMTEQIFRQMQHNVTAGLENCPPGRELDFIMDVVRPNYQKMWAACTQVKHDLVLALCRPFPNVRMEVFGSTVMGVAFKDSDFDFYVQLSREPLNMSPPEIIGKTMYHLGQSGCFANFCPIARARVPILKCYHIRTGYHCDINFTDAYGILNSPIVSNLLSFDKRICILATVIKYWAKVHDCAGTNRISSYAIMWMLLFYLQQLDEPLVPPIIEFQRRVPPIYINDYNFAFDATIPNKTANRMRFSELLLGFFKFYKEFHFASHIICPLFGKALPKASIDDEATVEFQRYREIVKSLQGNAAEAMQLNKKICIQDPFQLTRTIPGDIAKHEFKKIEIRFAYTAHIIEQSLSQFGESPRLLLAIFDVAASNAHLAKTLPQPKEKRKADQSIGVQTSQNGFCAGHLRPLEFHLALCRKILKHQSADTPINIQRVQQMWSQLTAEFLVTVLRDVFVFTVEECAPETGSKPAAAAQTKDDSAEMATATDDSAEMATPTDDTASTNTSDNSSNDSDLVRSFTLVGTKDVYSGRKQNKPVTAKAFDIEVMESKKRFDAAKEIRLKATVKISIDPANHAFVDIEFTDRIRTKKNNFFRAFVTNFFQVLRALLNMLFLSRSNFPKKAE